MLTLLIAAALTLTPATTEPPIDISALTCEDVNIDAPCSDDEIIEALRRLGD